MIASKAMMAAPLPPLESVASLFPSKAFAGLGLVARFPLKSMKHSHSVFPYTTWSYAPLQALHTSVQERLDVAAAASQKMNRTASRASWPKMSQGRTLSWRVGPVESRR